MNSPPTTIQIPPAVWSQSSIRATGFRHVFPRAFSLRKLEMCTDGRMERLVTLPDTSGILLQSIIRIVQMAQLLAPQAVRKFSDYPSQQRILLENSTSSTSATSDGLFDLTGSSSVPPLVTYANSRSIDYWIPFILWEYSATSSLTRSKHFI